MPMRHHVKELLPLEITPYRFAQNAGIDLTTIYALTNNPYKPISRGLLLKIVKALKCQPGDVLTYEPSDHD